ncbi:uncharacterized protein LOC124371793 [Homalodisca vitripennis]|uniref:uncharacterized protein LOC124371793 n=1 Tax=Homalodisca vitripennis TaxID=197043 RepID=UPI001EE9FF60|nr:uncharacterized protein LOC124371793 [Homalodisca vitripennis]
MQHSVTTIVDPTQPYGIFYLIDDSTGAINVGAALDTDNHETFIIFYFCSVLTSEGEPLVIVLSRSRNGLCSESQKRVDAALEANNICKDNLESFDVSDCADIYDYCFN